MSNRRKLIIPGVDKKLLVKDAAKLMPDLTRRRFLAGGASLGALTMLTGCNVSDDSSAEALLVQISKFNDKVQAALFNPNTLAPTFSESEVTRPFPFNAYFLEDNSPQIDGKAWKLEVTGLVDQKRSFTLEDFEKMPQFKQITRHICVEGWSAIGKWSGVRFSDFLERIGADLSAKYIGFKCADDYYTSIDMPTALHPQTLLTLRFGEQILPAEFGFPMKLRMPTKLGFKNPKHIAAMFVTNTNPGGYWEDQGYNWYSGS